jgi:hypothetical protein
MVGLVIDQYVLSPRYEFLLTEKFSGNKIYNPYQSINPNHYTPANFHAHATLGFGLFNGKGTANEIWNRYSQMGYGFHSVSQYQNIDKNFDTAQNYIPVYEHGYNLKKTHQLVINASHVTWKDYILPQTIANKQTILSQMAEDTSALIVLNHPDLLNGYTAEDLKYLKNYDCIELLNPAAKSFSHWDTALSNGNRIYAIGNDDLHDIHNNNQLGRFCNLIYSPNTEAKEAIASLKTGSNIVMWLPQVTGESIFQKIRKIKQRHLSLKNIEIIDDQMHINFDQPVKSIDIYGQGGSLVYHGSNNKHVIVPFSSDSSYLRCIYETYDGIKYILNPVYRYKHQLESRNFIAGTYLKKMPGNDLFGLILISLWIVFSMRYLSGIFPFFKPFSFRKRLLRRV